MPYLNRQLACILPALLALNCGDTFAAPTASDQGQPPPKHQRQWPMVQTLASDIHDNLERARSAIADHEAGLLRVAIQNARDDLTLLGLPAEDEEIQEEQDDVLSALGREADGDRWIAIRFETQTGAAERYRAETRLGWLPLNRARTAVDTAMKAAQTQPPDWETARTAVETGLTGIHWSQTSP
ncbi:hypothetical protein [Thiorhodococcus fuscus]|uniref:Uncharacterized protein n=1 Tax=Thiorhodococcus fuscus TaxID=527200 RepID=A0ABW4YCU3_9GAMM